MEGSFHYQPPPTPPPVYIPPEEGGPIPEAGKGGPIPEAKEEDLGHVGPSPEPDHRQYIKEEFTTDAERERPTLAIYKDLLQKHKIDPKGGISFTHQIASTDPQSKDIKLDTYKNSQGVEFFKATVTFTIQKTDPETETTRYISFEQEIYTKVRVPYGKNSRTQEDAMHLATAQIKGYCLAVTRPVNDKRTKENIHKIDTLAQLQFIAVKALRADRHDATLPGGIFYGRDIVWQPKQSTYNPLRKLADVLDYTGSVKKVKVEGKEYDTTSLWFTPISCQALEKHKKTTASILEDARTLTIKDDEIEKQQEEFAAKAKNAGLTIPTLLEKATQDVAIDILDIPIALQEESDIIEKAIPEIEKQAAKLDVKEEEQKTLSKKLQEQEKESKDLEKEIGDKQVAVKKETPGSPEETKLNEEIESLVAKKKALDEDSAEGKKRIGNLSSSIFRIQMDLHKYATDMHELRTKNEERVKKISDNCTSLNNLYELYKDSDVISIDQKKELKDALVQQNKFLEKHSFKELEHKTNETFKIGFGKFPPQILESVLQEPAQVPPPQQGHTVFNQNKPPPNPDDTGGSPIGDVGKWQRRTPSAKGPRETRGFRATREQQEEMEKRLTSDNLFGTPQPTGQSEEKEKEKEPEKKPENAENQ